MKKVIFVCSVMLALGLGACSGNDKKTADSVMPDSVIKEVAESEEEVIDTGLGYNITSKGIVPTMGRPMVVDFSADWCTPCKEMKPIFAQLKDQYAGKIDFVLIDTDAMKDLTSTYGIKEIPTFLFLDKEGAIKMRTTGFVPADSIIKIIRERLE